MNGAFVAYGTLTFLFALGLRRGLPERRGARLGAILLAVSGAGVAGLGLEWFAGVGPPLFRPIHDVLALAAYLGAAAACFATGAGLRGDPRWAGIARYSSASGAVAVILIGVSLLLSLGAPQAFAAHLPPVHGALQRALTGDLQLWVAVLGFRLLARG